MDSIQLAPSNEMLDEETYWTIIEKSLKETKNQEDQELFLTSALEQLSPKEMIGFRLRTDKLLFDSYTSNLWCANFVISNGKADDGFDYFRCWLISRGKEAYYKTMENPDYLVNLVENEPKTYDFEGFWYVAVEAFKNMTNKDLQAYIDYENFKTTDENYPLLEFNWNVDDPKTMEKVCPVLFKKFMTH
ncbi:polymerase [Flavobacterium glycines]|uniref:Polymerase n=1 Tax=Flavobacterium glycines TaxID=551990 RepID=A0A1B9DT10_9FLAO|nr:polymerase [Flavobacterium glycines]